MDWTTGLIFDLKPPPPPPKKNNLPLDLYVLIDLSGSMLEELNTLKAVSGDIGIASVSYGLHMGMFHT